MIDRKEIELLIRSKLQGKADIQSIVRSIKELDDAIDKQAAAAKRGEGSIDDLKASMLALRDAQNELTQRAASVGYFQKLGDQIGRTEQKVTDAAKAFADYKAKLDAAGKTTDTQAARLAKLAASSEKSAKALNDQRANYERYGESLKEIGVDITNLARAENELRTAAADSGVALNKVRAAISTYADDTKRARDAAADLKKAEDELAASQAKATKEMQARQAVVAKLTADAQRSNYNAQIKAEADLAAAMERRRTATEKLIEMSRKAQAMQQSRAEADAVKETEKRTAVTEKLISTVQRLNYEQQQRTTQRDTGLAKIADDAEKASRSYTTLARASTNLRPKVQSLRDVLDEIKNPGNAARASLEGVEDSAKKLAATISSINGPLQNYQDQFKELRNVQQAVATQAGLVDNFKNQAAALRDARTELTAARQKVAEYAAAVRQGGDAGESFVKSLADAQNRVRAASAALQQQINTTREARAQLSAAGIDTRKLADAEARLVQTAQSATNSTRALTDAVERYGQATAKPKSLFGNDEGRTTLSLIQRIRGEILALAAAYVGLQGALGLAGGALDAFNKRQSTQTTLAVGLGTTDRGQVDAEYKYIRDQAERLGLVFDTSAAQFAKFSAAAAAAGRGRQEIRYIFESFAEGGRVLGLTEDNMNGVFLALQQIFSKGKIGAEELTQQLGERLPAVFQVAQKALADQFPNLNKAMEQGQVGAENLVKIAGAYRQMVAEQLPTAVNSLAANQARLTNAVADFKLAIADAGFADQFTKFIQELTTFLRTDDGKKFASDLASGFGAVLTVLRTLIENFDTLKVVLGAIGALWASSLLQGQIKNYLDLAKAVGGASTAIGGLQKAFMLLNAAIVGFAIGTYLYNEFAIVREAGAVLVTSYALAWSKIKFGAMELFEDLPRLAENAFKGLVNAATTGVRGMLTIFAGGARALGQGELASNIEAALGKLTMGMNTQVSSRVASIRKQAEEDEKRIRQIANDMIAEARAVAPVAKAAAPAAATSDPGVVKPGRPKDGPSEGDIRKRASEVEAITRALETLSAKIDRTQTDTLAKQLDAIDTEYQALARRIKKLGGAQAAEFTTQLEAAVGQLKMQTTKKFNDKLLAEQESLNSKLEAAEAAAGRKNKNELDSRLKAIETSYAATFREIADLQATLGANGLSTGPADEAKRRLQGAVAELQVLERQKFAKEELTRRETELNEQIALRDKLVANVRVQEAAGNITEQQAVDEITRIQTQQIPAIQAAAEATRQWALANASVFANGEQQALFLSTLDAITAKATTAQGAFTSLQQSVVQTFTQSALTAINSITTAMGGLVRGTLSWKDALRATVSAIGQMFAEVLKGLAQQIIQQQILNGVLAISKALGWTGLGNAATAMGAKSAVLHSGGVVGQPANRSRNVPATWFANAPRYHGGGVAGLSAGEYPAILKKNEEVLSTSDPRNVMNGMKNGTMGGGAPANLRAVLVDDRSRIPEAMNSPEGEQVFLMNLERNLPTVKQMLKG